jgi:hypothetical protein
VDSFTIRPLYPREKSPCCPLDRGLSGPQSRSGHGVEENLKWQFFYVNSMYTALSDLTVLVNKFPPNMIRNIKSKYYYKLNLFMNVATANFVLIVAVSVLFFTNSSPKEKIFLTDVATMSLCS